MKLFPFISEAAHVAIVRGKDEQIQALNDVIADLRAVRAQEIQLRGERDDKLMALVEKSLRQPVRPRGFPPRLDESGEAPKQPGTLDLSMVDPNDNEALALIAGREMPPGAKPNAAVMMRNIERLRSQVIEAHQRRVSQSSAPVYVPAGVASLIDAAENAGRERAVAEAGVAAVTHG